MSNPGDLDATFGVGGRVTTDFSNNTDVGYSVAIQQDGKIVLGGYANINGNNNFALARYDTSGNLDTTFGVGGRVTTDFSNNTDGGYSVAIQQDGKIVLGGYANINGNNNFALARYDTSGSLDTSFGVGGRVTTDFNNNTDVGYSVAFQPDGKIILGGYARIGSNENFALARYNSNGNLDTSFGVGGKVNTDFSGNRDECWALAIQKDGKIVLGGLVNINSNFNFGLARYDTSGNLDTSFGVGGKVNTDFLNNTDHAITVAIQQDGKIILGGYAIINGNNNFALARYDTSGNLDTSFGQGTGKVNTDFANSTDQGYSVAIQKDGKIILGGRAYVGSNWNFGLARYYENGSIDTTFGVGGRVTTDFSNNNDYGYSVAIQQDGKIILGGYANINGNNNFALARYLAGTVLSKSFSYYKSIGYTDIQIKEQGFAAGYFKDAGYSLTQLKTLGFTGAELKQAGFSIQDFITVGYTKLQLLLAGFTNLEIQLLYLITETTDKLTFVDASSITLMTSGDETILNIDVSGNNMKYYNLSTGVYETYTTLRISSNGWIGFITNIGEFSFGQSNQQPINTLRYFSFDAQSTIKYYFDSNSNLMISTTGSHYSNTTAIPFTIVIKIEPNGKITVDYKNVGSNNPVNSMPIIGWVGNNTSVLTDSAFYSTFDRIQTFNAANINGKTLVFDFTDSNVLPVVPICFPAGTPVLTDQGIIAIEKINSDKNTIRGKKIVAITKTITIEDKIVCIEKDALGKSVPSQKTLISRNHEILYNKKMIKAKQLIGQVDGVYNKKYNGEILYNVLLETHEKMLVNNLIVETLNPTNIVAQLYNGSLSVEEINNVIININQCANDYKKVYGKLK